MSDVRFGPASVHSRIRQVTDSATTRTARKWEITAQSGETNRFSRLWSRRSDPSPPNGSTTATCGRWRGATGNRAEQLTGAVTINP